MNRLDDAINALNVENRLGIVMKKIGLASGRERITVSEASHKSAARTKDATKNGRKDPELKK